MTDPQSAPEYGSFRIRRSKRLQPLRRSIEFALVRGIVALARRASVPMLQRMGRGIGLLLHAVARKERGICDYQLRLAMPHLMADDRRALIRRCFREFGMTACETLALPRLRAEGDRWVTLDNAQALVDAHARGRGVLLVTAHYGNWELLPVALARLDIRALAVIRPMANPRVHEAMLALRRCDQLDVAERGSTTASRRMLSVLRKGDALVLAVDQDIDAQGVFVDFFGIPAHTPRAPASLALKLDAAVVCYFDERQDDGTHILRFRELPVTDAIREAADPVRALTQAISDATEAQIRARPEQWAWHHRRWKRRPPGEAQPPEPPPAAGKAG